MRYLSIIFAIFISLNLVYGESDLSFYYGRNPVVSSYDSSGNLTGDITTVETFGGTYRFTLLSTPVVASPKLLMGVEAAYFVYDTMYSSGSYVINPFLNLEVPFGAVLIAVNSGFNIDYTQNNSLLTDGINAFTWGARMEIPLLHGTVNYVYTLPSDSLDLPDLLIMQGGLSIKIDIGRVFGLKLGTDAIYRKIIGNDAFNLSILPYVGIRLFSLEIEALAGLKDEYGMYGVSVMGSNTLASGVGITARLGLRSD